MTLRGEFPNPKHELLPGMYVRVQIEQGIDDDALAVPQQAIRRNDAGGSEVHLVRDDNRTVVQPVRLGRVVDEQWLVLDGLKPADRVVVEGFRNLLPETSSGRCLGSRSERRPLPRPTTRARRATLRPSSPQTR